MRTDEIVVGERYIFKHSHMKDSEFDGKTVVIVGRYRGILDSYDDHDSWYAYELGDLAEKTTPLLVYSDELRPLGEGDV